MTLYADTSCLLKLLRDEPETTRVEAVVAGEATVVISDLARLEAHVQIRGRRAAGLLTKRGADALVEQLERLLVTAPFELRACSPTVIEDARLQVARARRGVHCRTLGRLHLAAMAGMGVDRLFTNDDVQAGAARALGIRVVLPR